MILRLIIVQFALYWVFKAKLLLYNEFLKVENKIFFSLLYHILNEKWTWRMKKKSYNNFWELNIKRRFPFKKSLLKNEVRGKFIRVSKVDWTCEIFKKRESSIFHLIFQYKTNIWEKFNQDMWKQRFNFLKWALINYYKIFISKVIAI